MNKKQAEDLAKKLYNSSTSAYAGVISVQYFFQGEHKITEVGAKKIIKEFRQLVSQGSKHSVIDRMFAEKHPRA